MSIFDSTADINVCKLFTISTPKYIPYANKDISPPNIFLFTTNITHTNTTNSNMISTC